MSSLSIAKSRNLESTAPKKGSAKSNTSSRRKVPSTAATAKKPPRSVESKAERVGRWTLLQPREQAMARADHARAGLTIRCAIYTRKSSDEGLAPHPGVLRL